MMNGEHGFAALDALAASHHGRGAQPGLAYGVVKAGRLVHAAGLGVRRPGGEPPDGRTVFRIASMTKSFTAGAVLALRDDGVLALDDPVGDYVPEVAGWRLPSEDSPPMSLRHLLTMTAGFPTDDPWGDRQQGLALPGFAAFLAAGVSFAWAPGTRFEYSNLGYAILGRVITAASGQDYPGFIRDRLLRPLGMTSTGFDEVDFPPGTLAQGHRRTAGGWARVPLDACGAFAPMGGVFSCVADLARWVSGFAEAFPPGSGGDGGPHPLRRSTRREMQLPQVTVPPAGLVPLPGGPAGAAYGYGLFIDEDPVWGRIVHHSGGYPGFGSHMRWHPASGTGVIVLANATYAPARVLGAALLDALLTGETDGGRTGPPIAPAPGGPWPATLAAQREVMLLLGSWDEAVAARLFSENVALDQPLPQRRRATEVVRERLGGLREDPSRPGWSQSPAHRRWWLRGERGVVAAEIRLTPERRPRIQSFTVAVPPASGSVLSRGMAAVLAVMNGDEPDWPRSLAFAGDVDTGLLARRLRMAAAWAGRCRPGAYLSGDGETSCTVELDGEHASLALTVEVDAAGMVRHAEVLLSPGPGS